MLFPKFLIFTFDDASNDSIYYPIVWSEYLPKGVMVAEKIFGHLETHSEHRGRWRKYGYGMSVMQGSDMQRLTMDTTNFQKWGGEDVDFKRRAEEMDMAIIRQNEPGLVHKWHEKKCVPGETVSQEFYDRCVDSVERLEGSEVILFLKERTPDFFAHLVQLPVTTTSVTRTNQEVKEWVFAHKKSFESGETGSFAGSLGPVSTWYHAARSAIVLLWSSPKRPRR